MKSQVRLSKYSILLTIILTGVLLGVCILCYNEKPAFYSLLFLLILLLVPSLFFAPVSVKADNDAVTVSSIFKSRKIRMNNIRSVELFQPTMGAIRICASGGYMGYWGQFREGDIGQYTAYYGKSSDCFLIRTKDGRQYVLGCQNPSAMVGYISSQIK